MTLLQRMRRIERLIGIENAVDTDTPVSANGSTIPHRVWKQADLLPDTILEEYEGGDSCLKIALRHKINATVVRVKLRDLGVKVFRRGPKMGQRKLTTEQIGWALEQDLNGMSHMDISKEVGVSRERIRQICMKAEHPTRRGRMTKMVEVREQIEARKLNKQKLIESVASAYAGGATLKEVCEMTGREYTNPHQAYAIIQDYRRLRPELFPYRMLRHWKWMTTGYVP